MGGYSGCSPGIYLLQIPVRQSPALYCPLLLRLLLSNQHKLKSWNSEVIKTYLIGYRLMLTLKRYQSNAAVGVQTLLPFPRGSAQLTVQHRGERKGIHCLAQLHMFACNLTLLCKSLTRVIWALEERQAEDVKTGKEARMDVFSNEHHFLSFRKLKFDSFWSMSQLVCPVPMETRAPTTIV